MPDSSERVIPQVEAWPAHSRHPCAACFLMVAWSVFTGCRAAAVGFPGGAHVCGAGGDWRACSSPRSASRALSATRASPASHPRTPCFAPGPCRRARCGSPTLRSRRRRRSRSLGWRCARLHVLSMVSSNLWEDCVACSHASCVLRAHGLQGPEQGMQGVLHRANGQPAPRPVLAPTQGLPLFILANWRGFSGGQRDLFEGVLQVGGRAGLWVCGMASSRWVMHG